MKQTAVPQQRRSSRLLSWVIHFSAHRRIHGVPVAVWERQHLESIDDKVRDALESVRQHDRRAFDELAEHTHGIFVFGTTTGSAAQWWRDEKLVVLQSEYAAATSTTSPALAVILVHEATHAWLERRGFKYTTERRVRLERICNRRALRLARRLPSAGYLVSWLQQEPHAERLTDEAFRQRAIAELVRLGLPRWLVQQMDTWSKRLRILTRGCSGRRSRAAAEPPC
jgi:hypothetical protein